MVVDIVFVLLLIFAVIKGYQRGLIVALFSIIAFMVGLAAAIKLSTVVAGYIGESIKVSDKWLPVISFVVVFIIVILLVRLGARLIQKSVQFAMLGWLNRLGGIVLYILLYMMIFSIILFYADQINILSPETTAESSTYPFVKPWGPKVIDAFGTIIPFFRDMFSELEDFFENLSHKLP